MRAAVDVVAADDSLEIEYLPSEICGMGAASGLGLPDGTSAANIWVAVSAAGIAAAALRNSRRSCWEEQPCERWGSSALMERLPIGLGLRRSNSPHGMPDQRDGQQAASANQVLRL